MPRPTVDKTAMKSAPGIRKVTRTYADGGKVIKYEARVKVNAGRTASLGMFPDLASARRALVKGKHDAQRGPLIAPSAGKVRFLAVAEDWLAGPQVVQAKPSTRNAYAQIVHGRLAPLHDEQVRHLTHRELSRYVAGLTAQGLASSSIGHAIFVLRCVLDEAVRQGVLASNPSATIKRPRLTTVEPYVLDVNDVETLIAYLAPGKWSLLVEFAAYTGCRASEMVALRVRDLDVARRSVRVRGAVTEVAGKHSEGKPKTRAGDRLIQDLSPTLFGHLAQHTAGMDAADYLFGWYDAAKVSHPYRHSNFVRRVFNPACVAVGLPTNRKQGGVGVHDLRHFHATLCIERQMTPMEVAKRLGHSNSIEVSRRYAHVWERVNSTYGADFDSLRSAASGQAAQRASQARTGDHSNVVPLRRSGA